MSIYLVQGIFERRDGDLVTSSRSEFRTDYSEDAHNMFNDMLRRGAVHVCLMETITIRESPAP